MRRHVDLLAFAGLLALWIYQGAVLLQGELRFTADSERDLFYVLGLSEHGILPADGIRMAALGLDLGPLYFLLLAPFNALWPSPQTVHLVNLAIGVAGLTAFFFWLRRFHGATAALIGALLYTQSSAHVAMTDTIWHVGAAPGVALGMIAAMGWWERTGRTAALLAGGVLLTVLVQLHALGSVYVPAAVLLLVLGRRHLTGRRLMALGTAVLITALPLLIYAVGSLTDSTEGAARHAGGFAFAPDALASGLFTLAGPRYLLSWFWGSILVLGLAATALVGTALAFRRGDRPWMRVFLIVQLLVGAAVVSIVLPYENVGRYFLPIIYPLFALAALGVADADQWLAGRGRPARGRALTWAVLLGCLALVQPASVGLGGGSSAGLDYLSAREQETVVEYLVRERGLAWPGMRGRVHGAFFGPLSGIRYLERVRRDHKAASVDPGHWTVLPEGMPAPDLQALEHVTLPGVGRTLHLWRHAPRFDPGAVLAGSRAPCPWPFPYLWSETPEALLKSVGFTTGHGPDIHRCLQRDGTLIIPLAPDTTALTIQISDEGHFRGVDPRDLVRLHMEAEDAPSLPLAAQPVVGAEKLWYRVPLLRHDGARELHITLSPRGPLGFLDVY